MSYPRYFLGISLCVEMPSQVLTVLQKLHVRRFGSIVIGAEKFGSNQECRSLRSACKNSCIMHWWAELNQPLCWNKTGQSAFLVQHTLKIGNHSMYLPLSTGMLRTRTKTSMSSLLKFGEKHFFLEAHHGIFQWTKFFSKFVVASTLEDKIVIMSSFKSYLFIDLFWFIIYYWQVCYIYRVILFTEIKMIKMSMST